MLINLWIYIYAYIYNYNNHFYVCNNLYVILNMHQLLCNDKFLQTKQIYENIVFNDQICWLNIFPRSVFGMPFFYCIFLNLHDKQIPKKRLFLNT
jgi:hypothetical protein